ncbi:MAG: hypothetical protein RXR20_33865 [Paraburkholderia sp.]|uniref:hypothetical protein n=1 Tax=Burkholderiaceae TaxID=119060 RepID=UPI0010F689EF|nr:hypothetical protein [Burkholderia sp. 4M9327F10]
MNQTSSVITGGVTVTAATLVPLVQWAIGGFPKPVPPDIPYLIAAGLVTGAHAAYNLYAARSAAKAAAAKPAAPAA